MRKQPVPVEVENYFYDLSSAARALLYPVIDAVRDAMPHGYELGMHGGMPGWVIPLRRYPDTATGAPLRYVSLAVHENHHSLYLHALRLPVLSGAPVLDAAFRAEWAATGRVLDLDGGCLRFRSLADVDLDIVARAVAGVSMDDFIAGYERGARAS